MRVGIRFADNDYYELVRAFIELHVIPTFYNKGGELVTDLKTDDVVHMFNQYVPFLRRYLCWLKQTWDSKPLLKDMEIEEWHRLHFTIEAKHVYWDGATDEFLDEWDGWNNSEFHWTDGNHTYSS